MIIRVLRGWSAESVTVTQIAKRMAFSSPMWKTKRGMLKMLGKRAGKPKRTKITIIIEHEENPQ